MSNIRVELERIVCNNNVLIACVGSPLRRDDSAGLVICSKLLEKGFKPLICEYGLENCLYEIISIRPRVVLLIDAVYSDKLDPGDIVLLDLDQKEEVGSIFTSTHSIPLNIVVDIIGRTINLEKTYLLGVRIKNIDIGTDLSIEVQESVNRIVETLVETFNKCREKYIQTNTLEL